MVHLKSCQLVAGKGKERDIPLATSVAWISIPAIWPWRTIFMKEFLVSRYFIAEEECLNKCNMIFSSKGEVSWE
jgi:hypothetical protein